MGKPKIKRKRETYRAYHLTYVTQSHLEKKDEWSSSRKQQQSPMAPAATLNGTSAKVCLASDET